QAPVTGESLPVDKARGDEVFAGTINGRGALEVRMTRLRRDTTLARIIHLVERAQAQRAPAQALVERFARIYTPAVMLLAAAVERRSAHPIAQAILRHAASMDIVAEPAEDVAALPGRGAEGRVNGHRVVLGNHRLFEERQLCSQSIHDRLGEMSASGRTPVLV